MRIKKSQQHLVSNNETSRLPYWVDDGYDDIQRTESQKHIMDIYGRFPESENQLPYNDDDYQALEYQYQDQFHDPDFKAPPFNTENDPDRKPEDCLDFWNQLFRGFRGGAFTASVNRMEALRKYSELCPVEYATKLCCRKGLRVHGPPNNELDSGASFTFTLTRPSGVKKCEYDFWATKGDMRLGGTYKAPKVTKETYDLMGVRPFLSDDKGDDCLTWSVKIKPKTGDTGDCTGSIGYTTLQMQVSGTQTLTVVNPTSGETYYWAASSGSIDATGLSVTYTAPAINPNCENNPTITLTCGGSVVDTITMALNTVVGYGVGYKCTITQPMTCTVAHFPDNPYPYRTSYTARVGGVKLALQCNGSETICVSENMAYVTMWEDGSCALAEQAALKKLGGWLYLECKAPFETWFDNRSAFDKLRGCCPAQLTWRPL